MHITRQTKNDYVPPRNQNYEKDIRSVSNVNNWILSSIGIWPSAYEEAERFFPKILIVFGSTALCFAIIPCALHIVYEEKDTTTKLKLLGLLSFCVTSLMKFWALAARRSRIRHCIEHMMTDWKLVDAMENRMQMLKYGKVGQRLTIVCATFMYTGGFIYHTILQYAMGTIINEYNQTQKPLVYPTYTVLFDAQRSPVYELVYIAHCTCGYVMYSVTSGACGLAALCVTHVCGQIKIIESRLNDLVDGKLAEADSTPDKRLKNIVECHLRVLRFSENVEEILQEVCLVEFVGSTFLICLLEYYCLTDWENSNALSLTTYALLLISLTFNVFILCYIGELLMEKTTSIATSCFITNWYQLPTKTMRGLVLIIAMSSTPIKISAGRMVELSLSTFGRILKTSVAYLSFLRTAINY